MLLLQVLPPPLFHSQQRRRWSRDYDLPPPETAWLWPVHVPRRRHLKEQSRIVPCQPIVRRDRVDDLLMLLGSLPPQLDHARIPSLSVGLAEARLGGLAGTQRLECCPQLDAVDPARMCVP
jgi:hypothetical protein